MLSLSFSLIFSSSSSVPVVPIFTISISNLLPSTVRFGIDQDGVIEKELTTNLRLSEGKRPVFVVGDTFNRVVYASQGYNTSLGTMLERLVREL